MTEIRVGDWVVRDGSDPGKVLSRGEDWMVLEIQGAKFPTYQLFAYTHCAPDPLPERLPKGTVSRVCDWSCAFDDGPVLIDGMYSGQMAGHLDCCGPPFIDWASVHALWHAEQDAADGLSAEERLARTVACPWSSVGEYGRSMPHDQRCAADAPGKACTWATPTGREMIAHVVRLDAASAAQDSGGTGAMVSGEITGQATEAHETAPAPSGSPYGIPRRPEPPDCRTQADRDGEHKRKVAILLDELDRPHVWQSEVSTPSWEGM